MFSKLIYSCLLIIAIVSFSSFNASAQCTPPAPPQLTATTGPDFGQITLSWIGINGAASYFVRSSADNYQAYFIVPGNPGQALSMVWPNLDTNKTYSFKVIAYPCGNPLESNIATATTRDIATPTISGTPGTWGEIIVTVNSVLGASNGNYPVFISDNPALIPRNSPIYVNVPQAGGSATQSLGTVFDTNKSYYFYTEAYRGSVTKQSPIATVKTKDIDPPKLTLNRLGDGMVQLLFAAVPGVSGYIPKKYNPATGIFEYIPLGQPYQFNGYLAFNAGYPVPGEVAYYLVESNRGSRNVPSNIVWTSQPNGENLGDASCQVPSRFSGASAGLGVYKPVNVSNGNMYLSQTDYSLPGIGEPIDLTRWYNSQSSSSGLFGAGWSTAYDENLTIISQTPDRIKVTFADGRAIYFERPNSTSLYLPTTKGEYSQVAKNADNTYTLTFKDGGQHQFSTAGKLVSQKDRIGNLTTLTYDANGNLSVITDPNGRTLNVTTNLGVVSQISDALGVAANYAYNPDGTLQSVTYPDGSKYQFEYVPVGPRKVLATVKDALNNILETHQYDALGRATTSERQGGAEKHTFTYVSATQTDVTDALGRVTKYFFDTSTGRNVLTKKEGLCNCGGSSQAMNYFYDANLNLTKTTDALLRDTLYTHDAKGNVLTKTDPLGTESYTYNSFNQILTRTDRMNGVWTNTYDAQGKLLTTTDPLNALTTLTYTPKGQVATVKDARNKITTFTYDTSGRLSTVKDPNLKITTYTYDLRSRVATVKNALNFTTTYNYDLANRLNKVTYPDTKFEAYGYDLAGRRTSMTDQKGLITTYAYDPAYRLISVTDPLTHTTQYAYDLMSNRTGMMDALGNSTTYQYDEFDRLKKVIYPVTDVGVAALEENYEYDLVGNLKRRIDTAGRPTVYAYDNGNRLISTTDPNLKVTQFGYNARSQMTSVTDAANQLYQFTYDPLGRQLSQTRAGTTMSYTYDPVGNRISRTDYKGIVTNYVYDNLNRLTNINYPNAAENITYTYDNISRLLTAVNYAGTVSMAYNNRNRLTSTTDVHGKVVAYTYDANGNRATLKLSTITEATYTFDNDNRLTNIKDGTNLNTVYGYDIADRLISKTLPNGVATTYQYDAMSRLRRLKDDKGATNLYDRQYSYNTGNNISQILEPTGTKNYGYDNLDRLTGVTGSATENYGYDFVGNRTSSHLSASYTYQANNRMASTATASFVYDNNGNMTSKTVAGATTQFVWDYENRLRTFTKPDTTNVQYKYDALGRRSEQIYGNGFSTKFTYDKYDVILDTNSDATTVKYLNGLGVDNKLKMTAGATVSYFVQDHLGSTNALTSTTGTITSAATYDAYGNITGNLTTRYAYTGREYDSFTGMHYYRARYYDSNLGRFLTEDPIGLNGGINQFGYVRGNPLKYTDPNGLDVIAIYNRQPTGGSGGELTIFEIGGGKSSEPFFKIHKFGDGLFSGKEECKNQTTCDTSLDKGPTPAGVYLIGERRPVEKFNNTIGYPLYKSRSGGLEGPFDFQNPPIKDPHTGGESTREGGFYIHAGLLSLGCITFTADQERGQPGYPSSKKFNSLDDILRKTPPMYYKEKKYKGTLFVF